MAWHDSDDKKETKRKKERKNDRSVIETIAGPYTRTKAERRERERYLQLMRRMVPNEFKLTS